MFSARRDPHTKIAVCLLCLEPIKSVELFGKKYDCQTAEMWHEILAYGEGFSRYPIYIRQHPPCVVPEHLKRRGLPVILYGYSQFLEQEIQ